MTIRTPEFQGTHLWDSVLQRKSDGVQTDYRIVWKM